MQALPLPLGWLQAPEKAAAAMPEPRELPEHAVNVQALVVSLQHVLVDIDVRQQTDGNCLRDV